MLIDKEFLAKPDDLLIFVHIPKCAGMSMFNTMVRAYGEDHILAPYSDEDLRDYENSKKEATNLAPYRALLAHLPYGEHEHFRRRGVYVTLVRDPVDRFLSLYAWIKNHPEHWLYSMVENRDLAAFWRNYRQHYPYEKLGEQCYYICRDGRFEVARDYIDSKYLLAAPIGEFGRFVRLLSGVLNFRLKRYRIANRSSGKPKISSLERKLIEDLKTVYSEDFRLFKYISDQFGEICRKFRCL
ncbi:MAG: hypothetical protein C4B57_07745 [Deltaproteobacteria bacterium]|nr:MAG: hypothetical protein C4B57_07745 [Deltaproteobacteria bacterium]